MEIEVIKGNINPINRNQPCINNIYMQMTLWCLSKLTR